jgi:hypothetical protein
MTQLAVQTDDIGLLILITNKKSLFARRPVLDAARVNNLLEVLLEVVGANFGTTVPE